MNDSVIQTIAALDAWENFLVANIPAEAQPLNRIWGWNMPSLTREDIVLRIGDIREKLKSLPEEISDRLGAEIAESPERLNWITSNVLPNLPSGNAYFAVDSMYQEFDRIDRAITTKPMPDWEVLDSEGQLPRKLTTRLRALEARLKGLEPRSGELENKIRLIEDASATAEQLPTDLATLAEGRQEINSTRRSVESSATKVQEASKQALEDLKKLQELSSDAEKLFDRLENVYKAGATKGLASAFSEKAFNLNISLYGWVALLVADLGAGAWIGSERFTVLQEILKQNINATAFWANFAFSLASVAPAIWLGWVSTKQINQRFKLAEDYSFKASVALAYEGYRSEAVRLDPAFEKRLFGSALTRLEEAPLRFVDAENFGTPWHELTSSPAFAKALSLVPDLKGTVAQIVSSAGGAAAGVAGMLKTMTSENQSPPPEESEK